MARNIWDDIAETFDNLLLYATYSDFPIIGKEDKIYVIEDTGEAYRWSKGKYFNLTKLIAGQKAQPVENVSWLDGYKQGFKEGIEAMRVRLKEQFAERLCEQFDEIAKQFSEEVEE